MIRSKNVMTMYPIVSVMLTYNSKLAVTVTKKNDSEYWIKHYSLETYAQSFEEKVGGDVNDYIKLKEVEQNEDGTKFAIAYLNDGAFRLRVFGEVTRTPEEIEADEVDINEELGLDNSTMPIHNFPDPFIVCTFVNNKIIYVCLFHNKTLTHHHFFWNCESRRVEEHYTKVIDSNDKNFPYKCFYNYDDNEVYAFYRQGQSFRVPVTSV